MKKDKVLEAANVMIAYTNGSSIAYRSRGTKEPVTEIETPRWNWNEIEYFVIPENNDENNSLRILERELADAHDRIRMLVAERNTARLQADQKINLREEFRELLRTDDIEQGVAVVSGLQERIKRLEEAGNAMAVYSDNESADNWYKAKEAK